MNLIGQIEAKIARGEVAVGTYMTFTDSALSELMGNLGYDFLWLDMEHTALDKNQILYHLIAAQAAGKPAFLRVPWNDPVLVKPVLDIGPDALIIPNVRTKGQAEYAIAACAYPPEGVRGFGPTRAARYGQIPAASYIADARKAFWRIVQIEDVQAVQNIDEILSVEGIDSVLIGLNDLSGSAGLLGQTGHPKMMLLYDQIAEACRRHEIPFGVAIAYDETAVRQWMERGISWISIGADFGHIVAGASAVLRDTRVLAQRRG